MVGKVACLCALSALAVSEGASARDAREVVSGNARFQVLSPSLMRMEYSPTAKFVDESTVAVIGRDGWPESKYGTEVVDGWLNVTTDKMTVSYKVGSGPFGEANLKVKWSGSSGERAWKPGDKDDGNLGGLVGDIAHRTEPVTDPGPLSRGGYFLLDDSRTALRDKATEWVKPRAEKDSQDWYFFAYGQDYAGMLGSLARLLGPVPMIPRYVLGTWFGSRANYDAGQWKLIAERFREEKVPLDVFVLDSCSWTSVVWSGYDWDYEQMPDPKGFFSWMHQNGVHVTLNEHFAPLTKENDRNFETIRKAMGLPEDTKEISHDLSSKKYAQLYMDLLHKPAMDDGMDFWWQDGCAPAPMEGLDPMMWTREVEYEGQERISGKRAFVFCRLGAWGSHRSGGFFSGDLIPEWDCFKVLVPFNIQGGNMLVPYVNNLAVAVYGVNVDPELYIRWTQFSSFSPIFWYHGLWGMRLPWEYGDQAKEICKAYLGLRERLVPYTYTHSRIAHETGLPIVRGLYLQYPDQEQAYGKEQYLYGHDLLVAPITEPNHGKPVLKDIFLPSGENWYDYATGRIYSGGQTVPYEAPLDRMPLFVRAGAIVPMAPEMNYVGERPSDPMTLNVYASDKQSSFKLYEDDGESLDYRQGKFAWTTLTFAPGASDSTLTIGAADGSYKGQLAKRRYEIKLHGLLKPKSIGVNGKDLDEIDRGAWTGGWFWDSNSRVTTIRIADALPTNKPATVKITGAGVFDDAIALQRAIDFRERVRLVKHEEKLKYAVILNGREHGKPPRCIRETEKVEVQLNSLVANPSTIHQTPPDYRSMAQQILAGINDKPFESDRAIPELNPSCKEASEYIAPMKFEPAEVRKMTAALLGLELPARVLWKYVDKEFTGPYLNVDAKLIYDADIAGPNAKTAISLELPEDGLPGWSQGPTSTVGLGYTRSGIAYPFPQRPNGQTLRLKATLTWDGGQVETRRDVQWESK